MSYNGISDSTMLTVKADPRIEFSIETAKNNQAIVEKLMKKMELLAEGIDRVKEIKTIMSDIKKQMPKKEIDAVKNLKKVSKEVGDSLKALTDILIPKEGIQGIYRDTNLITNKLRSVRSVLYSIEPMNTSQKWAMQQAEEVIDKTLEKINKFFKEEWGKYKKAVKEADISPFKEYKPLKLD